MSQNQKYQLYILGVPIYFGNISLFTNDLIYSIEHSQSKNRLVSARDAHGLVLANQDPPYKKILNNFYCNLPDGMPLVWIGKMKGARLIERCTGFDTFVSVMSSTAGKNILHFFCGGKEDVAIKLKTEVEQKLNNYNVVNTFCPPFRNFTDEEYKVLGEQINASGANIVWIGLSTPKQEFFATELAKYCNVNYIICIGAVFDFYTGKVHRAPKWMQQLGLEWLYRVFSEPKRLLIRYIKTIPLFIYLNIKEILLNIFIK